MCGILGCIVKDKINEKLILKSLELIAHRGPDDFGIKKFFSNNSYVFLGHSRLSIIDLTVSGSQPFISACGNYTIIFNGEIYNYKEIKNKLIKLGYKFKSKTDTEVLLYSLVEWGINCLNNLIGMFAFVFYDKKKKKFFFARDAFGIKPLFYYIKDEEIFFSSDIYALKNLTQKKFNVNLQKSYDYLVHGDYDSDHKTFVENIFQLRPANYFIFDLKKKKKENMMTWWKPNLNCNKNINFDKAAKQLKKLFLHSIKLHLRSDVPLGLSLSGGIDSSAIASAVKYLKPNINLNTFSFIANDKKFSEERWIDYLNKKLNFKNNKILIKNENLSDDIENLCNKHIEPFGDLSIYAQYKVFEKSKSKNVIVILEGQGSDELFAGYFGYPGHRLLSLLETTGLFSACKFAYNWSNVFNKNFIIPWLYLARIILPDWIYKILRFFYNRNFSPNWLDVNYLKKKGVNFRENRPRLIKKFKGQRVKESMLRSITGRGLPGLLRHSDRNSMAFSIENRVPFLTIPIANFVFSLPENFLISDKAVTKNIFRESMRGIVADKILDRKDKIGFASPTDKWLLENKVKIKNFLMKAKTPAFLNIKIILKEIKKNKFNSNLWRKINYIYFYNFFFKK